MSVIQCIESGLQIDPNISIAVVSSNGKMFELNLSAAIIYEELIKDSEVDIIVDKITSIFDINYEKAKKAVENCIDNFLTNRIIVE